MEKEILTEKRLSKMEEKLDNLTNTVKEVHDDIKEHIKWEAEKYEKLDTKYSAKWVESGVIGIITSIIIASIVGLFSYVLK